MTTQQTMWAAVAEPERWIAGTVYDWSEDKLDPDALVAPLGLSGDYTVVGIDDGWKEDALPRMPAVNLKSRRQVEQHVATWTVQRHAAQAFTVTLTPEMTLIHLVRLAAVEHVRRNGDGGGHIYFATVRVRKDRVIEFAMDS